MLPTILLILLITHIIFIIYLIQLKYKRKLIFNKEGEISEIIMKMKSSQKPYNPTPWLFNTNLLTINGLRLRGRSSYNPQREDVFFKDGGQSTIEYFVKENLPDDAPITYIIIL